MRNIRMLDCTLRDGGCVNDFQFGQLYMDIILNGLERSGIEIIELGYIDSAAGSERDRTQYCNEKVIYENFLHSKKSGVTYVAMTDFGKYDPALLEPHHDASVDGIRLAFHKKDRKNMLAWGRTILEKGYKLYVQPMTCLRYSDEEMLDLIRDVNTLLPETEAFYIVDSFGEMRLDDMYRLANLVNHNLAESIAMGLHSHNNLQLSYSNAVTLLNFPTKRDLIFDASIMGMGKGAGNMTTELFAEHLNLYRGKQYQIAPLLEVVDKAINQIRENYTWGYAIEYYLSAANHCTPSYAGHFYRKHMLSVDQVAELLGMIAEEKKISFDKAYADALYYQYNETKYNDEEDLRKLSEIVSGKEILLIAPGKSVCTYADRIREIAQKEEMVCIAVNNSPIVPADYAFVTKKSACELVRAEGLPMIATSNIHDAGDSAFTVNYASLTHYDGGVSDNSAIMLMNLLIKLKAQHVYLAGFDGFSTDVDANYYDEALKRPVDKEQADSRNALMKKYLNCVKKEICLEFVTPSMYQ